MYYGQGEKERGVFDRSPARKSLRPVNGAGAGGRIKQETNEGYPGDALAAQ